MATETKDSRKDDTKDLASRSSNAAANTKQIWVGLELHQRLSEKANKEGRTIRKTAERMLLEALDSADRKHQ